MHEEEHAQALAVDDRRRSGHIISVRTEQSQREWRGLEFVQAPRQRRVHRIQGTEATCRMGAY